MKPYQDLALETSSFRNRKGEVNLPYDQSLVRLEKEHLRHLRPIEAFGLLIDSLEGKLRTYQSDILFRDTADDMLRSWGEWLSLAIERHKDYIQCYFDPTGLKFMPGWWGGPIKYVKTDYFAYAEKHGFPIPPNIPEGVVQVELSDLSNEFSRLMTGRSLDALPEVMREGGNSIQVVLPSVGMIWPVSRTYGRYNLNANTYRAVSRGAVEISALYGHRFSPKPHRHLRLVT